VKYLFTFFFSVLSVTGFSQVQPITIKGFAQGTTYSITYYDAQHRNFQTEIKQLLLDFDYSVSTYQPYSIISRVNRNEAVAVDDYFRTCFYKAKEVWKNTQGTFDPTVLPLVNAWGFGPGKKINIEKAKIDSILSFVGFDLIDLKGTTICKKDPRVSLDFNAFAQGYSVDVVSNFLKTQRIESFVVEIGGEVYANGNKSDGSNWQVGIEQPYDNQESENPTRIWAKLENLAIATSGNNRQYYIEKGIKYSHHINPKSGYPAKNTLLSASVFAADCISADAYATGLLVMGLSKAQQFLVKHPELQAYLIYSDEFGNFKEYQTPGLQHIVVPISN
jgi:thiamine biosynthesis lipoprotein